MPKNYRHDSAGAEKVSLYLQKNLYNNKDSFGNEMDKISLNDNYKDFNGYKFKDYSIVNDTFNQIRGTDVKLIFSNGEKTKQLNIDEKAAIYYATDNDSELPTFAFELYTEINAFGDKIGWTFNKDVSDTNLYLLNWIHVNKRDYSHGPDYWWQKKDVHVTGIHSYLLDKKDVQSLIRYIISDYFNKTFENDEDMVNYINHELRKTESDSNGRSIIDILGYKKRITLQLNRNKREQPINIIIPRYILKDNCIAEFKF